MRTTTSKFDSGKPGPKRSTFTSPSFNVSGCSPVSSLSNAPVADRKTCSCGGGCSACQAKKDSDRQENRQDRFDEETRRHRLGPSTTRSGDDMKKVGSSALEKEASSLGLTDEEEKKEIKKREKKVDDLKSDSKNVDALSEDVKTIISNHTFYYLDEDDYDNDGDNEYGRNYTAAKKIMLSSLHWDSSRNLDKAEFVDTYFHEIQHSRSSDSSHGDTDFQAEINTEKGVFHDHWGNRWK